MDDMAKKLKVRITKCYLVEVIDENGYVQYWKDPFGLENVADDYCFGNKDDAVRRGKELMEWVQESEDE